jgi:N-acetyl-beta-hexosaminidase
MLAAMRHTKVFGMPARNVKSEWRMNIKDVDELQSYFVKRVEKIVESKGKKLIGWDDYKHR